jgi:hypothetical protein
LGRCLTISEKAKQSEFEGNVICIEDGLEDGLTVVNDAIRWYQCIVGYQTHVISSFTTNDGLEVLYRVRGASQPLQLNVLAFWLISIRPQTLTFPNSPTSSHP